MFTTQFDDDGTMKRRPEYRALSIPMDATVQSIQISFEDSSGSVLKKHSRDSDTVVSEEEEEEDNNDEKKEKIEPRDTDDVLNVSKKKRTETETSFESNGTQPLPTTTTNDEVVESDASENELPPLISESTPPKAELNEDDKEQKKNALLNAPIKIVVEDFD